MPTEAHIRARLAHLRHPGQISTIAGARVAREAFRYRIQLPPTAPSVYVYSVPDAVAALRGER